jgi:hypothetical protein
VDVDGRLRITVAENPQNPALAGSSLQNPRKPRSRHRARRAVIAGVRTIAADNGLSPDMAEATYRAMISAFIAIETEYSGKLNAEISQSPRKSNHAGERIESPPATARAA